MNHSSHPSSSPILIAECCQNHNGNLDILKRMIHEAAAAGADYVKIQAIRSREVAFRERFEEGKTLPDGTVAAIKRPYAPEVARLQKLDLTIEQEAWFVRECQRAGVRSMTTVFTRAGVQEVKDLGYDAIKIASYDCKSYPLLRDVAQYWRTVVMSTGATFDDEIEKGAAIFKDHDLTLLHCVTMYPTPFQELHLARMAFLRRFASRVGYSDHSKPAVDGMWPSMIALALGAECVERHFTVLGPDESRDGPVSMTPGDLRTLRAFADLPRQERMARVKAERPDWETALGQMRRSLSPAELLNRDYYAGRFASQIDGKTIYNWEDCALPNQ